MKTTNTKKTSTTTVPTNTNINKEETVMKNTNTTTQKADNPIRINCIDPADTKGYYSRELDGFIVFPSSHYCIGRVYNQYVVAEGKKYIETKDERGWDDSMDDLLPALSLYNYMALRMSLVPEGFEDNDIDEYDPILERMLSLLTTMMDHQNRVYLESLLKVGYTEVEVLPSIVEAIEKEQYRKKTASDLPLDLIIYRLIEDMEFKVVDLKDGTYEVTRTDDDEPERMTERDLRDEYHFVYEE